MHFTAGNPYAPDSVSDWWNFSVNALIGVATAVTLIVTVVQARQASRDALSARRDAARASAREDERERLSREDDMRLRAARQALSVWVNCRWDRSGPIRFRPVLHNDSDAAIRDVRIHWPGQQGEGWALPGLNADQRWELDPWVQVADSLAQSQMDPPFTVEFTDIYRDRWSITYDRTVRLLHGPKFVLPNDSVSN
ncbi:hypothetical protein [Curtobacterium sp. MCPF17_003]|uniref:hypothetical protein n=1 Tax=Curtobacterium sp. MCPF17_003 TaxID=2175637 RepID=UPI0011B5204C|nr:hypothetical protein [Curtobacterium sp. MCPF17_003]